jgi:UbiA prenyltransferase family.
MPETLAPAYYTARSGGWRRDLWAVLHPPYTAWHLSYVVIGASLAPKLDAVRLIATLLAFFLAVGISAHALDELKGRPLGTELPGSVLKVAAATGLIGAVALGVAGVTQLGPGLLPFIAVGVLFVFAYNLELLGGKLHGDFWFALSWGAFPVLTAYFAQTGRLSIGAIGAAMAAFALSFGQRSLSTPARLLRRRSRSVTGIVTLTDGSAVELDQRTLLRPLEQALQAFSWGVVALAAGMVASKVL